MKKTLILVALAALFFLGMSTCAVAADVSGTWKFAAPQGGGGGGFGGGGGMERTLILKQDGNTLTGKYVMKFGDNEPVEANIENGKVSGDEITFTVKMPGFGGGPDTVTNFKAKVAGDKMEGVQESPRPFSATRSK
jgi:hypothetical protein